MKFQHILHLRTFFCIKFLIFTFPNTLKVFASHFGGVSEFFFRATLASAHFVRCQNFPEFFLLHLQLLGNASVLWCNLVCVWWARLHFLLLHVLLPRSVFSCNRCMNFKAGKIAAAIMAGGLLAQAPKILFDPMSTWPYLEPKECRWGTMVKNVYSMFTNISTELLKLRCNRLTRHGTFGTFAKWVARGTLGTSFNTD